MTHLCRVFAYFGFRINWKPGKTECFLRLRGRHASAERDKSCKTGNVLPIPLPMACGSSSLRIVSEYKHLGSSIDSCGSVLSDVSGRVSSAMSAYAPIAKKVSGATRISRVVRERLFTSLVVSRLLYNVHTWSKLTRSMYSKLNAVYMRGLRRVAGKNHFRS
jgi:hypothetical protein